MSFYGTENALDIIECFYAEGKPTMRRHTAGLGPLLFVLLIFACAGNNPGDASECEEVRSGICRCSFAGDSNIKLTYPNGGETIYSGGRDSLRFCVRDTGLTADSCLNAVRGEISLDNGNTWESITITDRPTGRTSFAWYVADEFRSSDALLRIILDYPCGMGSEDIDRSDRSFRIR